MARSTIDNKGIVLMLGPAQSPDLNAMEHLWEVIKKKLEDRPSSNMEELKEAIFHIWQSTSADESGCLNVVQQLLQPTGGTLDASTAQALKYCN